MTKAIKPAQPIQFVHPKKQEFIELYRTTRGFITDICRSIGIARQTYYDWLDADKEFAMAVADAEAEINDEMKQILIDKAGSGDLGAVIFWLKNKHPEFKYNKDNQVNVQVNNVMPQFVVQTQEAKELLEKLYTANEGSDSSNN